MKLLLLSTCLHAWAPDADPLPPKHGHLQIVVEGKGRAFVYLPKDRKFLPPWRDALIAACKGTEVELSKHVAGLRASLGAASTKEGKSPSGKLLSFTLEDATLHTVLDHVAQKASVRIVNTSNRNPRLAVKAKDVTWREVVSAVSIMLGLAAFLESSSEVVITHPDRALMQMETHVFRLLRLKLPQRKLDEPSALDTCPAMRILRALLSVSPRGTLVGRVDFDVQTRSLIVQDTKEAVARVRRVLDVLEAKPD